MARKKKPLMYSANIFQNKDFTTYINTYCLFEKAIKAQSYAIQQQT